MLPDARITPIENFTPPILLRRSRMNDFFYPPFNRPSQPLSTVNGKPSWTIRVIFFDRTSIIYNGSDCSSAVKTLRNLSHSHTTTHLHLLWSHSLTFLIHNIYTRDNFDSKASTETKTVLPAAKSAQTKKAHSSCLFPTASIYSQFSFTKPTQRWKMCVCCVLELSLVPGFLSMSRWEACYVLVVHVTLVSLNFTVQNQHSCWGEG